MIDTEMAKSESVSDASPCGDAAGDCADGSAFESTARELYQTAALFLGDADEATDVVEQTLSGAEVDPCADRSSARTVVIRELVQHTLARAAAKWPTQMHPSAAAELGGCVDTDELSSAGLTRDQLETMITGAGRGRMRQWLEGLGPVERVVFVLRAVLGRSGSESTELLQKATADPWTEAHVGGAYRAALCSLASAAVHASVH
jgi:DNA-directed RNA polymerase specialized sigma24 family protein